MSVCKKKLSLVEKIWLSVNIPRFILCIMIIFSCQKQIVDIIFSDVAKWHFRSKFSRKISNAFYLLSFYKEFRNLTIYRIRMDSVMKSYLFRIIYPPLDSLYIYAEKIGRGLFIQHGFSTIITAKEIGNDCHINQQVTIGHKGNDAPIIGDRVKILAGAIVIGNINLGNDCIVGAGAVVTKDVPAGAVVVGNPAYIIKYVDAYSKK